MGGTWLASFNAQRTVIHALILHDLQVRFAHSRLGVLIAVIEPLLFVIALYALRVFIQGATGLGSMPLEIFLATGYLLDVCFRTCIGAVSSSLRLRVPVRMFPQVSPTDIIVARSVTSVLIGLVIIMIGSAAAALSSGRVPYDLLLALIASLEVLLIGAFLGILVGCLLRKAPAFKVTLGAFFRINIVFSGAAFLGTEISPSYLHYVKWNPTFHCIELMREAWLESYHSPAADPMYVLMCLIFLAAISLQTERLTRGL